MSHFIPCPSSLFISILAHSMNLRGRGIFFLYLRLTFALDTFIFFLLWDVFPQWTVFSILGIQSTWVYTLGCSLHLLFFCLEMCSGAHTKNPDPSVPFVVLCYFPLSSSSLKGVRSCLWHSFLPVTLWLLPYLFLPPATFFFTPRQAFSF